MSEYAAAAAVVVGYLWGEAEGEFSPAEESWAKLGRESTSS